MLGEREDSMRKQTKAKSIALVREDDYGITYCANCLSDITCDENGDFSDECQNCNCLLDWSEWEHEQDATHK